MKSILLLILVSVLFSASVAKAQSNSCSCQEFPYFYCDGNGNTFTLCTDNPNGPLPSPFNTRYPNAKAEKAPSLWGGCIKLDPNDQDNKNCGWVNDGTLHPGVVTDPYPGGPGNGTSIGDLFYETVGFYGYTRSKLEDLWYIVLSNCLGSLMPSRSDFANNRSCCINVDFKSDPSWWAIQKPDPTEQGAGDTIDLTRETGYTNVTMDISTCVIECTSANIDINTTPTFFNGTGDPTFAPTELERNYVAFGPGNLPANSGTFDAGPWQDVTGAWHYTNNVTTKVAVDFSTVMIHELGHLLGLAHTDANNCLNTGGAPCGTPDPNSVMNSNIPTGKENWNLSTGDCCRIQKLYYPSSVPPCPADAVNETPEPFNLALDQSQPNPTTGTADIGFSTDRSLPVTIEVYDVLGKKMLTLANQQFESAGHHTVSISEGQLASGKYIYSLRVGNVVISKEMTVIK